MKFKMIFTYPSGTVEECDDLFDTYEEADREGEIWAEGVDTGFSILSLSNPGYYDELDEEDECSWEIIEIDD